MQFKGGCTAVRKGGFAMKESADLMDFLTRRAQDLSMEEFYSREDGVLEIGHGIENWTVGNEAICEDYKSWSESGSGVGVTSSFHDPQAFSEGTVGWAAWRSKYQLADGSSFEGRVSAVFHKEDGEWACVSVHRSVGTPIKEIFG
jgi:hypothetical protein